MNSAHPTKKKFKSAQRRKKGGMDLYQFFLIPRTFESMLFEFRLELVFGELVILDRG